MKEQQHLEQQRVWIREELRKKMLTNAFAAEMKVASVKMEQLTAETLKVHAEAELLSRELLLDAAGDE